MGSVFAPTLPHGVMFVDLRSKLDAAKPPVASELDFEENLMSANNQ